MKKKLFIKSYGCQMNEYDSAKIADIMADSCNFETTEDLNQADLIILNTCSIRAKAEEKIFSELGRLRDLKKKNPDLILAVGGCVAAQEKKTIFRRAPYVSIVFGPQTLHLLPEMYNNISNSSNNINKVINTDALKIEKFDYFPSPKLTGPTALVSIMEGCNKFCSYCIVPYTRGREVSRPMVDIINEINELVAKGAKEISLLGQNVNSYLDPNNKNKLADLIIETAKISQIKRIRFTTSHPAEFGDDLIAVFKNEEKLVSHLHLPIQSGSNKILKLMRRGYTHEEYQEIISKLRIIRPNIKISSDFIVGFPGETEQDFEDTISIIRNINFDNSFSFIYSPRPNTLAAELEDNVSLKEKKQRLEILQNQINSQTRKYNQEMIGTTQKVLITNYSNYSTQLAEQLSGRTESNRIVNFTAPENKIGDIVEVKITESLTNSLRGEVGKT